MKTFSKIFISISIILIIVAFYGLFFLPEIKAQGEDLPQQTKDVQIATQNPFSQKGMSPADMVSRFYQIGMGLAGASALGVIIYGAILYSLSEVVTSKEEAKNWISGGIWGLVLILGAFIILKTINPSLVNISETQQRLEGSTQKVAPTTPASPTGAGGRLSENDARKQLNDAGVGINNSSCSGGQTTGCTNLDGIKQSTIDEAKFLNSQSNLKGKIIVTGGTEGGHGPDHTNGNKIDLRDNPDLTNYIDHNFQKSGTRPDNVAIANGQAGATFQIYTNPQTGAQYVYEGKLTNSSGNTIRSAHWDVYVPPK